MTNIDSSLDPTTYKTHEMKLYPAPFDLIKSGRKTVEMRLNDEKRRHIKIGDCIRFVNVGTGEKLVALVIGREEYPTFYELYREYDKISIGYGENEVPDPSDMLEYYTEENIEKYGALALIIELV